MRESFSLSRFSKKLIKMEMDKSILKKLKLVTTLRDTQMSSRVREERRMLSANLFRQSRPITILPKEVKLMDKFH